MGMSSYHQSEDDTFPGAPSRGEQGALIISYSWRCSGTDSCMRHHGRSMLTDVDANRYRTYTACPDCMKKPVEEEDMAGKVMSWLLLLTAIMSLTSCSFVFATDLQEDGSGMVQLGFRVPFAEARTLESLAAISLEEICAEADFGGDSGDSVEAVYSTDGGMVACLAARAFDNVQDLARLYEDYGVEVETLGKQRRRFEFEAVFDLEDISLEDVVLLQGSDIDAEIEWQLTMPGTAVASNADEVDGSTFIWRIPLGSRVEMRAETNVGGIPLAVLITAAAVVSVLLLVGGFFLLVKRGAADVDHPAG